MNQELKRILQLNIDISVRVPNTMKTIASVQHFNLTLSKHIPAVYGHSINTEINRDSFFLMKTLKMW